MQIQCHTKELKGGRKIEVYTLVNKNNMLIEILTLGGIITKILVPDREGKLENVILAYKDLDTYIENPGHFGAIIGRTGGRIYQGEVHIGEDLYHFPKNSKGNTLHGGNSGFDRKIWDADSYEDNKGINLALTYTSQDGEEGYPGTAKVTVIYTLTEENTLIINYSGTTTKDTLMNLTNHSYFNLSGDAKRDVLNQQLVINSERILELDENLIPTGAYLSVAENLPFDFREAKPIGNNINDTHLQIQYGCGYDHAWVLSEENPAAKLFDPESGRCMQVETNQRAVVVFTHNFPGSVALTNGECAKKHDAICFETQNFPIGHNEVFKEGAYLKEGETYHHQTMFKFTVI